MSKTKNNGPVPGADPTSPMGMTLPALAKELITTHGYTRVSVLALSWEQRVDMVVQGRLDRELEAAVPKQRSEEYSHTHERLPDGTCATCDADPVTACEKHEVMNCAECSGLAKQYDKSLEEPHMFEDVIDVLAEQEHQGLLVSDTATMDYTFNGHAGAGPSSSERWLTCTASLGASRAFLETLTPNQQEQFAKSNEAARQGTTAHAAAEVEALVVLGRITQQEADLTLLELAVMPESDGEAYDEEMGEYITEYVDLVRGYVQEERTVLVEARVSAAVPLTGSHEGEVYEINGSADFIAMPTLNEEGNRTLVVGDLKYGKGINVDVDENSQARIYALGALALLADADTGQLPEWLDTVTYHIIQPRLGGIKTRSEPLSDLLDWRDEVLAPALTAALYGPSEGAAFSPSETACQFCPARGGCPALAEQRLDDAADLFDAVVEAEYEGSVFPETTLMTDTRLGELLVQITGLIDIHKDLKAEAERRLFRGDAVPGFQLVNYTPPRKWLANADDALDGVSELWTRKLITPTAAMKLARVSDGLDEDDLALLIDAPPKRPVVAREGDRRKPWEGRPPEQMFEDES